MLDRSDSYPEGDSVSRSEYATETLSVPLLVLCGVIPVSVFAVPNCQTLRGILEPRTQNQLTSRNTEECPGHNMAGIGVTAVRAGGPAQPRIGDAWTGEKKQPSWDGKGEEASRNSCSAWQT